MLLHVSKEATQTLNLLTADLNHFNKYGMISSINPKFPPVHTQFIESTMDGDFYSVKHIYDMNNILIKDPEVIFLKVLNGNDSYYFPISYQQNKFFKKLVTFNDMGRIKGVYPRTQNDYAMFCNAWIQNIKCNTGI